MLEDGIVRHSKSPYNSPLLLVAKKSGANNEKKFRLVIDFRNLNKITVGDSFPLPRIDEILDQLGNSRYFTTLDLASGYHQVEISEEDKHKTAFSTPLGHFEFNRMPFGLTAAPSTFQRIMNYVLTGLQGISCFVYLDDIVTYGRDLIDHNKKLTDIFERLRLYNLKLNIEKCQFLKREVIYLGHKCSAEGVCPDPSRVDKIRNLKRPHTLKQLQSLMGFLNYYRKFIDSFSEIASPISKLLRKNQKFIWNEKCDKALEILKEKLTNPPLLIYPDFSKPFKLATDASMESLGAVLSQDKDGSERPIAYASRVLNKAEKNYSVIERELLAIVWAVRVYRHFLFGRKFVIYSDHKPLRGVINMKDTTSRITRFNLKLSDYDYTIEYRSGKSNGNADFLSRLPQEPTENCLVVTRAQKERQEAEEKEQKERNVQEESESSEYSDEESVSLESDVQILKNKNEIETVLREFHNSPLNGHQGTLKTYERIKRQYRWKGMVKDIRNYIKKCEICLKQKTGKGIKMPLVITDVAKKPFEKIFLDIVGPLNKTTQGNVYILTIQDDLSKFFDCYPLPNQEASTVAKVFYEEFITRYRIPDILVTDQGSNFTSKLFKQVCKFLKIKKLQTSAYHPQSNGALERTHRPLIEYLRCFVQKTPNEWDTMLRYAVHVHNNTIHSGTRFTPMDCLFGFTADLPSSIERPPKPVYNHDDWFFELQHKLQTTHKLARENLQISKKRSKKYYDRYTNPKQFQVGEQVLLKNEARKSKLDPVYIGPYEITKINSDVNSTIKIGNKDKTVHNNRLKLVTQ